MVEQVGSGIGRIKDRMKAAQLSEPLFKTEGMFTVVLQRPEKSSGKSSPGDARKEIIKLISINSSITREELANSVGITVKGVDYHLTKMQKEGILERKGSRKTGIWVLYPSTRR
jgi:ATP-dependent DNA helicase RecG